MDGPYRLVSEIHAHSGPIRSMTLVSSNSNSLQIVTGCQADSPNIRKWFLSSNEFLEIGSAITHSHWVTALTFLPSGSVQSIATAAVVTGCYDSNIRLYDVDSDLLLLTLSGHTKGIISFSWTSDYRLVSGSWDGTARIWDLNMGVQIHCLEPHENGVHVLCLPFDTIITTSTGEAVNGRPANFQIRFWDSKSGKQIRDPIQDHAGSIRSICAVPSIAGFATTSNDGTVAVRNSDGTIVESLAHPLQDDGVPPFVLDCAALISSTDLEFVSCGEDGSVVVWRNMTQYQSIPHPCCVWTVLPVPGYDGDFLTAGGDGVLRYFSRNPSLTALPVSEQLTSQFLSEVDETIRKRQKGPSAEDLAKASKWEQRGSHIGKSEGQVMLFNKSGQLIAAQWSMASQVWIEVGEVTGKGNEGSINGVNYDHVLPVEIDTPNGLRNLKLGYNNGENPFVAAQRFIDENELSQGYLGQIADWILQQSGRSTGPTFDMSSSSDNSLTGPKPTEKKSENSSSFAPRFSHATKAYVVYDDIPNGFQSKALTKIQEFNSASSESVVLTDNDISNIDALLKVLSQTSYYHSSKITEFHLKPLLLCLERWKHDYSKLFPVFDILRLVAVHPEGAELLSTSSNAISRLWSLVVAGAIGNISGGGVVATLLTSLRLFVNCFRYESLRSKFIQSSEFTEWMNQLSRSVDEKSLVTYPKSTKSAIASLLLNYSMAVNPQSYLPVHVPNSVWISSTLTSFSTVIERLLTYESCDEESWRLSVLAVGNMLGGIAMSVMNESDVNIIMTITVIEEFASIAKNREYSKLIGDRLSHIASTDTKNIAIEVVKLLR